MLLKTQAHVAGNRIRYVLDYNLWLVDGSTLKSGLVTGKALPADVVIDNVVTLPSGHLAFFLTGASLNETFTLDVQAMDSRGEVRYDTIDFFVTAP